MSSGAHFCGLAPGLHSLEVRGNIAALAILFPNAPARGANPKPPAPTAVSLPLS